MSIPHVDRSIAHVDRAVVPAPPAVVYERLVDLVELVRDRQDVRIEAWPTDGLRTEGATFWAVHEAVPAAGHAVSYEVIAVETPYLLDLRATSDLFTVNHRILVAPATGDATEVSWTVAFTPDQPTTNQLLEDAALLATVTLQELDTEPLAPAAVLATPSADQAVMVGDGQS